MAVVTAGPSPADGDVSLRAWVEWVVSAWPACDFSADSVRNAHSVGSLSSRSAPSLEFYGSEKTLPVRFMVFLQQRGCVSVLPSTRRTRAPPGVCAQEGTGRSDARTPRGV